MAGLAGVAATGVAVARAERRRRQFEPDDVRARLRERYQEALHAEASGGVQALAANQPAPGPTRPRRRRLRGALSHARRAG